MTERRGINLLVVPESLEADLAGRPTGQPSFAFRQVLAYVLQTAEANDQVYLAPANAFGGALTEEQVAYHYLRAKHARFQLRCPGINLPAIVDRPAYVDTWDNAVLLSRVIAKEGMNFELVTTALHARRAAWCFSRVGFDLSRVHAVPYVQKSEPVIRRNFYYRHPRLHRLYEALAYLRDRIKYGYRRRVA